MKISLLGQLILKIPWKNLYSEPVVAKVDGVYLLARPNTGRLPCKQYPLLYLGSDMLIK